MTGMGILHRLTGRRDDAAVPHEPVQSGSEQKPRQGRDDGQDGNSTPNGGR